MHLFQLIQKPVYQALLFIIVTIAMIFIVKPRNADNLWVICGVTYGFFILTNTVISFFAIDIWQYFFISLGITLLYLVVIAIAANILIKMLKLEGSQESAMIFLVIIFHPAVLLLSIFLKWAYLQVF